MSCDDDLPSLVERVASWVLCVFCPCISCFETRLGWLEETSQSSQQVALSWERQDEGFGCNTVSVSVVVVHSKQFVLELVCAQSCFCVHDESCLRDDEQSSQSCFLLLIPWELFPWELFLLRGSLVNDDEIQTRLDASILFSSALEEVLHELSRGLLWLLLLRDLRR